MARFDALGSGLFTIRKASVVLLLRFDSPRSRLDISGKSKALHKHLRDCLKPWKEVQSTLPAKQMVLRGRWSSSLVGGY